MRPPRSSNGRQLDLVRQLNERHAAARPHDPALEARIQSFELAYRMQGEAAEAFDTSREPDFIRALYGPGTQARQLLITRRLLERGVRFVQVWSGAGSPGTTTKTSLPTTASSPPNGTEPSPRS